jgi:hypothetical protein
MMGINPPSQVPFITEFLFPLFSLFIVFYSVILIY